MSYYCYENQMFCEKQQDAAESKECAENGKTEKQEEEATASTVPPSLGKDVKSTAIVKYEMVQMPVRFLELQPQTDLKQPPSNWLHGHSKWESYMQRASLSTDNPFSSFKMAHCFPELTGEIDAISDAENVKKLLKIPYSKAHVSMMVHRVGNTLLLDDFDIHKHLLRKQEADWRWLRRFYYETVVRNMADDSRCVLRKNKSRDHLQDRNMFSKFLYYSLADDNVEERESEEEEAEEDIEVVETSIFSSPDPLPETEMGQLGHQRTVVWNFEDLHMLIGANLPIFGGGTHPCVSLRLRDMRKPINVLTGLDYWLDNLMCNVPELAMCYHLNGIVKNYELIKTEDIPNMPDSHFSPKVVKDVAQNILSFLKSNATKEGHTYWLFKGHGDDIVKLYDLTTLSADCMTEDCSENPFTVPVGILLYRVARNIRTTGGRKKSGTIRTLLKNCIALLDKTLHPQIVTSAHYLLSDLYISDDIHNNDIQPGEGPEFKDDDEPDERETGEELGMRDEMTSVLQVQTLCWPEPGKKTSCEKTKERNELVRYPPVSGSQEERCREALGHIAEGLSCLHASLSEDTEDSKHKVETQAECNPSEAIPLHYEPLHPSTTQKTAKPTLDSHPYSVSELSLLALSSMSHSTWHNLSKVLLLRKASISYLSLAKINLANEKFGRALKYAKLALCSFASMSHMCQAKANENQELISAIWGLSGDIHIMLVQRAVNLEIHREDFLQQREEDRAIWESARLELGSADFDWVGDLTASTEDNLHRSVYSYRKALELAEGARLPVDRVNVLMKRYGNVENELGVYYMNTAGTRHSTTANVTTSNTMKERWQKSYRCFEQGIEVFTRLKDHTNVALLHSNTGRLMRLCAQKVADSQTVTDGQTDAGRREFSSQERHYLTEAQTHYKQALELLEKYHKNSKLTESVAWELCSSYFTMATLLQDFAPLSSYDQKTVEKEVTDLMMKALRHCNVDVASPVQQPTMQYRAATIHHRLASLYHNAYRNQVPHTTDQKRRHLRSLAELHYGKAYQLFLLLDNPCELLRVQLERVAMAEYQFTHQTSVHGQLKPLNAALQCLMPLATPVKSICTHIREEAESGMEFEGYVEEAGKLLGILASRLQFVLHNTIKSMMSAKKGKLLDPEVISVFKKMYAASLDKCSTKDDGDISLLTRCQHLLGVLANIEKEYRKLPTTYHPG